jgi:hypothetical protein
MISIDTHIPSGNILYDHIGNDGTVHLKLNKEFNLLTHWFYFKVLVDKIAPKRLTFSIDNASESSFANGWQNYAPFESLDGINWNRTNQGNLKGSSFSFNVDGYDDVFFLSWYLPYTIDKYQSWLDQISNSNLLTVSKSNENPDYITLGDKCKPAIVIVARQHPGESMTSFVTEGFVHSLINNTQRAGKLLEKYSLIIFPLLNKSGVIKGFHRVNENGKDLNRSWNSSEIHEIEFVKNQLTTFSNIHSIIDLHGDEVSTLNYVYFNQNVGNGFQEHFLNSLNNSNPNITSLPNQLFIRRFVKQLIRKGKILTETGQTLSEFGRNEYKARTYTLEVSAKTTTENDCKSIGQNILTAMIQQL